MPAPTATIIDLADALADELNGLGLSVPSVNSIPWERSYADWDIELGGFAAKGDVVPVFKPDTTELESRGYITYAQPYDLVLRARLDKGSMTSGGRIDPEDVDPLLELIQRINEHFCKDTSLVTGCNWKATSVEAWYVKKHLREWNQYTGIVRVTYDISRAL